jgi:hypothetical protein
MQTAKKREPFTRRRRWLAAALTLVTAGACSRAPKPAGVRTMPAGEEFSGFLSDYSKLKPNPKHETTLSYVREDPAKNVHKYVAIIVEPVVVYVATDVDASRLPDRGRSALASYFQQAITAAVADAFPVVTEPGPLVLRLRSAIIGVDVGPPPEEKGGESLLRTINIGKVGVEMELIDSETGEQIAAAIDRQRLGEGAVVGSATFSREEKFRAATEAFDGWAARLRAFLDAAHELSPEEVARVKETNQPYGHEDVGK